MQEVGGSIPPSSTNPFPAWRRSCTAGFFTSPSSRGLGLRPFTPATGVRIPLGTPYLRKSRPQAGFFLDIGFPTRTRTRSFAQRMGAVRTERSDRRHREAFRPAGPVAGGRRAISMGIPRDGPARFARTDSRVLSRHAVHRRPLGRTDVESAGTGGLRRPFSGAGFPIDPQVVFSRTAKVSAPFSWSRRRGKAPCPTHWIEQ